MAARLSDWHSGNPDLSVGKWIAAIIGAVIIYYIAMAILGSLLHGGLG